MVEVPQEQTARKRPLRRAERLLWAWTEDVDLVDREVDVDGGVDVDVDHAGPRWTTLDVDPVDRGCGR